jgi:hypothetical protein
MGAKDVEQIDEPKEERELKRESMELQRKINP